MKKVYVNGKIYGPYLAKDNRLRIVYVENNIKTTVSYPKYLMELNLNRYLTEKETVHHIDGNPLNNDLSNLQILERQEHCKQDALKRDGKTIICQWCKKSFFVKGSKLIQRQRKDKKSNSFCSKQCTGKYGAFVQNGGKPFSKVNIERTYSKSITEEIL